MSDPSAMVSSSGLSAAQQAQHRSTEGVLVAIQITHVRLAANGIGPESITHYKWHNDTDGAIGHTDKPSLVTWVDTEGNSAYVSSGSSQVAVGVVRPKIGLPYLKTHANRVWTDNLLALPRF